MILLLNKNNEIMMVVCQERRYSLLFVDTTCHYAQLSSNHKLISFVVKAINKAGSGKSYNPEISQKNEHCPKWECLLWNITMLRRLVLRAKGLVVITFQLLILMMVHLHIESSGTTRRHLLLLSSLLIPNSKLDSTVWSRTLTINDPTRYSFLPYEGMCQQHGS